MKLDRQRLQTLYPQPTNAFACRMEQLVHSLPAQKEETKVKRLAVSTVLAWVLLAALLCATAYAVINYGMEWYYNNRFTAYQQYEPEKYQAILENKQAVTVQNSRPDDLISVAVQEAAWVPEKRFLSIILSAVPKDAARYELHPMWNLDLDGSYIGEGGDESPDSDGIDRAVHWLWTEKGFGPIDQVMSDPGKQLLLFEASEAYLGMPEDDLPLMGDGSSCDSFVSENGEVVTVLEIQMSEIPDDRLQSSSGALTVSIPYTVTPDMVFDAMLRVESL